VNGPPNDRLPDWEAFYSSYRKPGYVPGYEITSKLGGGMFGLVFKATKQSIGKDYAIKFLKVDDNEVRRAVLAELQQVQLFAQVDHPNLVSIEDRGDVDGIPYLVMAYAGHETLRDLLPGDASTRPELLRLYLQACRGVAALHERSLVHFDLKPANVFLKGGVARVGDYGLSKLVTHSQRSLSMGRGTPYYMAPEMLQRRGDHRSDVYSLGVMLFEVLTGDVPFKGDSEWEVLRKHETGTLSFPDHVDERHRAIVRRCMHKDPEQRFQSVHDLIAVWHQGELPGELPGEPAPVAAPAAPAAPAATAVPTKRAHKPARRSGFVSPLLVTVLGLVALTVFMKEKRSQSSHVTAQQRRAIDQARERVSRNPERMPTAIIDVQPKSADAALRTEIRKLAEAIDLAAKRRTTKTSLRPVDGKVVALPADLWLHQEELLRLAETRMVSPVELAQLEALGFPIVVSAVCFLQEQDYRKQKSCSAASRVLKFLQQATGVAGLAVDAPPGSPDAATTRRFAAAADSWRKLVEKHCRDADAFRKLQVVTGKTKVDERKN
jgi:hypothetical protein